MPGSRERDGETSRAEGSDQTAWSPAQLKWVDRKEVEYRQKLAQFCLLARPRPAIRLAWMFAGARFQIKEEDEGDGEGAPERTGAWRSSEAVEMRLMPASRAVEYVPFMSTATGGKALQPLKPSASPLKAFGRGF